MLSGTLGTVVFFIGIVVVVVLSNVTSLNIGVVALAAAFILGMFNNITPGMVVSSYATSIFFVQFAVTLFFGFVASTGLFKQLCQRLLAKFARAAWAIPFVIFGCTAIVTLLGAGSSAPVVVSALAFNIALEMGMSPVLCVVSVYTGSLWACQFAWLDAGTVIQSIVRGVMGEQTGAIASGYITAMLFLQLMLLLVYYVAYKGYRLKAGTKQIETASFNSQQKTALAVVLVFIALIVLPPLVNNIVPNAVCKFMSRYFVTNSLSIVGALVMVLLKVGDKPAEVVKNRVPWAVIIMVTGMCTYVNLASKYGVVETLGNVISNNVPAYFVPAIVCLIGGLLSFVASGIVLWPMLMALVPIVSQATGCDPIAMSMAAIASCGLTGISPISQGGSLAAIGAPEEVRAAMFSRQFIAAFVQLGLLMAFALLGGFQLLAGIFA